MKKSTTVFLTTIFPSTEEYLDDFFESLVNQTIKNFDILVVNDGVRNFEVYKKRYKDLNIIEYIVSDTPSKNREKGIQYALKLGFLHIIFGDSDDYFSKNRVEKLMELHCQYGFDIVVNELVVFDNVNYNDYFLTKNIKNIETFGDRIIHSNIFGFSNTSIKTSLISEKILNFNDSLVAVDWFFITELFLTNNCRVKFSKETKTFYRQHNNNTVGFSLELTEEKLNQGIHVKETHYSALVSFCKKNKFIEFIDIFESKYNEILLLKYFLENKHQRDNYIQVVNARLSILFTGWWSQIVDLKTYKIYESKINK